jgi:hypothetical protein
VGGLSGPLLALRRGNEYDLPKTVTLLSNEFKDSNQTRPRLGQSLSELHSLPPRQEEAKRSSILLGAEGGKRRLPILPRV